MTTNRHQVVIIGAGINSLVAALSLARQGRSPLVFERRPTVGGIASTEEFHPGFRASIVAQAAGPLTPQVLAETDLASQGLEWLESPTRLFLPGAASDDGLVLSSDPEKCAAAIEKVSSADAPRYRETREALGVMAGFFSNLLESTPPALDTLSRGEMFSTARLGLRLRRLGKKNMLRIMRWLPMPAADLAEEWFGNEALRASVAARGVFAATLGPRSPGTAARALFQIAPWGDPFAPLTVPRGGMGALAEALAKTVRAAGAEVRTEVEVSRILVKEGRATGVAFTSGEEIPAAAVISGLDPSRTLLRMLDPADLPTSVLHQARNYRCQGSVALVHLALDALPRFAGGGSSIHPPEALAGRIQIGSSVDRIERAFDDAKYGRISDSPFIEATIPTILDPALAPSGKHVLSAWMQFAPYRLREGDWAARRAELLPLLLRALEPYAPGISSLVVGSRVLSPADLESEYGLTGGHVFHGDLAMDQMYSLRPFFGLSGYRGPIEGLYLCGSGTHPGIGVTGASGLNVARELIADHRRRAR